MEEFLMHEPQGPKSAVPQPTTVSLGSTANYWTSKANYTYGLSGLILWVPEGIYWISNLRLRVSELIL